MEKEKPVRYVSVTELPKQEVEQTETETEIIKYRSLVDTIDDISRKIDAIHKSVT